MLQGHKRGDRQDRRNSEVSEVSLASPIFFDHTSHLMFTVLWPCEIQNFISLVPQSHLFRGKI